MNTKYSYRIRVELNSGSSCIESATLHEHGKYSLNIQLMSTNSSTIFDLKCMLNTQRSAHNVYIPLIVGGIILLLLFLTCLIAQRLKAREYFMNLINRVFKNIPQQESTHSYDLQVRPPVTTTTANNDTVNGQDTSLNATKIPPIHKVTNAAVPRSKRLLSLDAFRGFGK